MQFIVRLAWFSGDFTISGFGETEKSPRHLEIQRKTLDKLLKLSTLIPEQVNSLGGLEIKTGQTTLWITSSTTEPEAKTVFHFN